MQLTDPFRTELHKNSWTEKKNTGRYIQLKARPRW